MSAFLLAVNDYARTRLRYSPVSDKAHVAVGGAVSVQFRADVLPGKPPRAGRSRG